MTLSIAEIMRTGPVIAVLTIEDAGHAATIARALVAGGVRVIEVTLRTPAAIDAIACMAQVPDAIVGAGTVLDADMLAASAAAGARFAVSPGLTEPLARAARETGLPFLPGVATAGDIMRGLDLGLDHFKFFPAEAAGGRAALQALSAPFARCRFCPTGGITAASMADWLALDNVLCVGGSWLVPRGAPDPAAIEQAARAATAGVRG